MRQIPRATAKNQTKKLINPTTTKDLAENMRERTTPKNDTPEIKPAPLSGGQGAGAAGTPVAGEAPYTHVAEWRRTMMGAKTEEIVICLVCKKVLEPSRVRRSRSGTHGEDYYIHKHPIVSVVLRESNSGRRSVAVPKELEEIKDLIERAWIFENATIEDIRKSIAQYLRLRSGSKFKVTKELQKTTIRE